MFLIDNRSNSVIDSQSKKVIRYNYDHFIQCIVKEHNCFICGEPSTSKPFNNEHVIPNWILRSYGTSKSFMVLPNGTSILHSQYTVPCCRECNTFLGKVLEDPISELLKNDFKTVRKALLENGNLYQKLFQWINLLFFKTHLKDSYLEFDRDRRNKKGKIGDMFCWHPLYHIHNVVRQQYTKACFSKNCQGTIIVLEALVETKDEDFDYLDNYNSQVIMVKVGQIVIFSVLNDCQISLNVYKDFLNNIDGECNTNCVIGLKS